MHSGSSGSRPLMHGPGRILLRHLSPHLLDLFLSSQSAPMALTRVQTIEPQTKRERDVIGLRAVKTLSLFHETPPFIGTKFALIG